MRDKAEKLRCYTGLRELSDEAMFAWDFAAGINIWNRGAEALYGFKEVETLGHNPYDLLQPILPCPKPEFESVLHHDRHWEGELGQRAKTGQMIKVWAKFQLIYGADGVDQVLETNLDLSNPKGKTILANEVLAELRGITPGSNKSLSAPQAPRPDYKTGLNGPDLRLEELPLQRVAALGKPVYSWEYDLIRADGRVINFTGHAAPLFDTPGFIRGVIGAFADVSECKRVEDKLAYQTKLLARVHDAIMAQDEHLRITFWSKTAAEIFGWTKQEVLGRDFYEIFPITIPDRSRAEVLQQLIETSHYEGEVCYRHKDGHYLAGQEEQPHWQDRMANFKDW